MRICLACVLLLTACGGEHGPDRKVAGPCTATTSDAVLTYAYDGGRLMRVDQLRDDASGARVTFQFREDGLDGITWGRFDATGTDTESGDWFFAEDGTSTSLWESEGQDSRALQYEAGAVIGGFPFSPDDVFDPTADDALVHATIGLLEYSYTYDGPARTGTRTRSGSDGSTFAFEYDGSGRLLADPANERTYTYEGELLVGDGAHTYTYDSFGNVTSADEGAITYDYGCY